MFFGRVFIHSSSCEVVLDRGSVVLSVGVTHSGRGCGCITTDWYYKLLVLPVLVVLVVLLLLLLLLSPAPAPAPAPSPPPPPTTMTTTTTSTSTSTSSPTLCIARRVRNKADCSGEATMKEPLVILCRI